MSTTSVTAPVATTEAPSAASSSMRLFHQPTTDSFHHACSHLEALKSNDGATRLSILQTYTSAVRWAFKRRSKALQKKSKIKLPPIICSECNNILARPLICSQCLFIGGWRDGHLKTHMRDSGHSFAVDLSSGDLFCAGCDDFVYDAEFSQIKHDANIRYNESLAVLQEPAQKRVRYEDWKPSSDEVSTIMASSKQLPCRGVRGLRNMGATCFMNSILQCFIHNPLLRNFFLSDKHNAKLCTVKDCMCCEMDGLFSQLFSDDKSPYGPTSFLLAMWQSSIELAGYAQQDAHEFFISAINQIHNNSKGSTNVSCNCIIHTTFAGTLQSDVTCLRCGNVTTAVDPIVDVSLDLRASRKKKGLLGHHLSQGNGVSAASSPAVDGVMPSDDSSSKNGNGNGNGNGSSNGNGKAPVDEVENFASLVECLERYTRAERLGANQYSCSKCGNTFQEATKQLSMLKLPPVLCFQLKRFEHLASAQKIESSISFPLALDMLPYTTSSKRRGVSSPAGETASSYLYDLFAVVNHEGQMNTGHYTNFCKSRNEWLRFDDHMVTLATTQQVLESKAYMCFYIKRVLDYE